MFIAIGLSTLMTEINGTQETGHRGNNIVMILIVMILDKSVWRCWL